MRRNVVAGLGTLLIALSLPAVGQAQNWIQIQGTIQAVDCQTNALVLNARDGTHVFPVAANATVTVNSAPVNFCALRQYVGSKATVTIAIGTPTVAAGVDVIPTAAPAAPPPALPGPAAPAPVPGYYGPYYPYYGAPYCYGPYYRGPNFGGHTAMGRTTVTLPTMDRFSKLGSGSGLGQDSVTTETGTGVSLAPRGSVTATETGVSLPSPGLMAGTGGGASVL